MRVAHNKKELLEGLVTASSEAMAAFGNPAVFLERYLANPKHIEVQCWGQLRQPGALLRAGLLHPAPSPEGS